MIVNILFFISFFYDYKSFYNFTRVRDKFCSKERELV